MRNPIEKALELGMEKVNYDTDETYYVASYSIHENGEYIKTSPRDNSSVTIEFKEDLSYAQVFWEDKFLFDEITVGMCLELVSSMNIVSEMFRSLKS